MADRLFSTGISETEYNDLKDKFITIPPGADGIAKEGDTITELVEASPAEEKTAGKSLKVVLTVVGKSKYGNEGKQIEWYPGVDAKAMGITKKALQMFAIEDKVIKKANGRVGINPMGFAGARARATFRREMSLNNNLRSVLDSTQFFPADVAAEENTPKDVGI